MRRIMVIGMLGVFGGWVSAQNEYLLDRLDSRNPELRDSAFADLQKAGPDQFKSVLKRLPSMHKKGQQLAALLLKQYAAQMKSVEKHGGKLIREMIESEDPVVRDRLASAVTKCGLKNASALMRALAKRDPVVRGAAISAMARIGEPARPRVERLLASKRAATRAAGLEIVAKTDGDATAYDRVVTALCEDSDPSVRAPALIALAHAAKQPARARTRLLAGLKDMDREVGLAAGRGLFELGPTSIPEILKQIESRGGLDCSMESAALRQFSAPDEITKGLSLRDPFVRLAVVEGFATPTDASVASIREISGSNDGAVRTRAASLLGRTEVERNRLVELAKDELAEVRAAAIWNLAQQPPNNALAGLYAIGAKDKNPQVRAAAWLGALRIDAPDRPGIDVLNDLLGRHESEHAARVFESLGPTAIGSLTVLVKATHSTSEATTIAAIRAIGNALSRHWRGTPRFRRERFNAEDVRTRNACARAWDWLMKQQRPINGAKGRGWSSEQSGGHSRCDVGVSSLAVLAFTAAGWHADSARYSETLRDAVEYLRSMQRKDGRIGTETTASAIQHALAANALSELTLLGPRSLKLKDSTRKALAYARAARNRPLGWRYRPQDGENDTFVSTWMVLALRTGEYAGLGTSVDAYHGVRQWLDKMTDPEFGQVGYNVSGGFPARMKSRGSIRSETKAMNLLPPPPPAMPGDAAAMARYRRAIAAYNRAEAEVGETFDPFYSQSTTSMSLLVRAMLNPAKAFDEKSWKQGAGLISGIEPQWAPDEWRIDLFYWMFGSRVMALLERDLPRSQKWREAVRDLLISKQAADGAWPANGVWGAQGGRVYSTSMAVMTLLAAVPTGPDLRGGRMPRSYTAAKKRLEKLVRDKRPGVAKTAATALAAIKRKR